MALPTTGPISFENVNVELGRSAQMMISMNETPVRALGGVPTGMFSMNDLRGKAAAILAEVLVIAGGGGGSASIYGGGGGGAGGVLHHSSYTISPGNITVTVGAGGPTSTNGSDSFFGPLQAIGGGRSVHGGIKNGGSGGGNGHTNPAEAGGFSTQTSNSGAQGYGSAGGASAYFSPFNHGSGGGAGGVGGTGATGGPGRVFSTSGASVTYAGGGGMCNNSGGATGGGAGGGGTGSNGGSGHAVANTGGGGGGSRISNGVAGSGGSGVVIVRYEGTPRATGGTITQVGGFTIHTFTGSGTFSFGV